MVPNKITRIGWMCATSLVLAGPTVASANTLTFSVTEKFTGGASTPVAIAVFEDTGLNTVKLTMTNSDTVDSDKLTAWYFNFDPLKDVTKLQFTFLASTGPAATSISANPNAYNADGGSAFDILFNFPEAGDTFDKNESVMYSITSTSPQVIDVSDFAFFDDETQNKGPYGSAIKMSSWFGDPTTGEIVPVPSSFAGLLSLALTVGGLGLWKKRAAK